MYINAVTFRQPATADHDQQQLGIAWPKQFSFSSGKAMRDEIGSSLNWFDYPGQIEIEIASHNPENNLFQVNYLPLYRHWFNFPEFFDRELILKFLENFLVDGNSTR